MSGIYSTLTVAIVTQMASKIGVFHFRIGILGQVWCLIVSIPDLCTLTYFE